jgi:hypothetical protein
MLIQPRIAARTHRLNRAEDMDLRIFLSSTMQDLKGVRENVLKLLSVIPADLVSMETFGSDESQPTSYCVEKVRGSNLFVGIYAERYGTMDPTAGVSIIELEYREALRKLEVGELIGLLVYVLDRRASWPVDQIDRDPGQVAALEKFKGELKKKHVVTMFLDPQALPLDVLRDILRKIGVGTGHIFRPKDSQRVAGAGRAGALGMEHYTERDAASFRGRETEVSSVCDLVAVHPLSLLIGDSGIGKTSLVQAGIFPTLRTRGWSVAWCRPLDDPGRSIPPALWHQLMEGPAPQVGMRDILQLIASAYQDRKLLIVIDQFEDIIPTLDASKSSGLLQALADAHNAPAANLHLVICYRGDAEPRVGRFWQQISSSASGLPRYYLGPLSDIGARTALGTVFYSQFPNVGASYFQTLVERIVSDVGAESLSSVGVSLYPPFLQMAAEGLIKVSEDGGQPANLGLYQKVGGAKHLIGRYLSDQLQRLGAHAQECRSILVNLSTNQRRQRKTREDIATQTGISSGLVDSCLLDLQNLRLVHAVEDQWEIVHDFLSQRISDELVAPGERESRLLRDVLSAKSGAYESTGELLTFKEHLGIYFHRTRIHCSPAEVEALFMSHLHGNGPIEYFLQGMEPEVPVAWAQRSAEDPEATVSRSACRFLLRMSRAVSLSLLAKTFSEYKLQAEMALYIRRFAVRNDIPTLLRLRSHRAPLVQEAAGEALERFVNPEDGEAIKWLWRRSDLVVLCKVFANSAQAGLLKEYRRDLSARSHLARIRGVCGLLRYGSGADRKDVIAKLRSERSTAAEKYAYALALALRAVGKRRIKTVFQLLESGGDVASGAVDAVYESGLPFPASKVLPLYDPASQAVGDLISRTARRRDARLLRRFLRKQRLVPATKGIALGLLRIGGAPDVRLILDLIGNADYKVEFWAVPVLTAAMVERADSSLRPALLMLTDSAEFWEYSGRRPPNPLPVRERENLYLFKRISGVLVVSVCDKHDWPLLKRLMFHPYWSIQVAAAEKIAGFATAQELNEIIAEARMRAKNAPNEGVMYGLNLLDQNLYVRPSLPAEPTVVSVATCRPA